MKELKESLKDKGYIVLTYYHSDGSPTAWWEGEDLAVITDRVIESMIDNLGFFSLRFRVILSIFLTLVREIYL